MGKLIRIETPHFVAGIDIYGVVGMYDYDLALVKMHRTAPILKYMRSWNIVRIERYCRKKGWKFQILGD